MFTTNTKTDFEQTVDNDGLVDGELLIRMLIMGVLVLPMAFSLFAMGADAQIVQVCSRDNTEELSNTVRGILQLLTVAAALAGTVAIALGFAADSAPFLKSDFKDYKRKGLIYGWGFVVILLFLSLGQSIIGLDLGCFFPV